MTITVFINPTLIVGLIGCYIAVWGCHVYLMMEHNLDFG